MKPVKPLRILIVGGGPVGLYQAIELAQAGHTVDLVEAQDWPRDKVCGEGVMPGGARLLEQMGVLKFLEGHEVAPFKGVRYISGGSECLGTFREQMGLGIRRTLLSSALYQRAREFPNLNLYSNTQLSGIDNLEGAPVTAQLRGAIHSWSGDFIIGADGIHSKTRRLLGVRTLSLSSHERLGARLHLKVNSQSDMPQEVQVYWGDGVEAYLTPNSADTLEIAFLWFKDRYQGAAANLEAWLWDQFPELRERYSSAERMSTFQAQGGFASRSERICGRNWALVGDSAYFFDGITGEGLSLGFGMARTLAWAICEGEVKAYGRQGEGLIRHNIYLTRLALFLARHSRVRSWLMSGPRERLMSAVVRFAAQLKVKSSPASELFKSSPKRHNSNELNYLG